MRTKLLSKATVAFKRRARIYFETIGPRGKRRLTLVCDYLAPDGRRDLIGAAADELRDLIKKVVFGSPQARCKSGRTTTSANRQQTRDPRRLSSSPRAKPAYAR